MGNLLNIYKQNMYVNAFKTSESQLLLKISLYYITNYTKTNRFTSNDKEN